METIAIYWESKISTYGFNLLEQLIMGHVQVPLNRLSSWGAGLQEMADESAFRLVWAQTSQQEDIKFFLLCDDSQWHTVESFFTTGTAQADRFGPWQRHPEAVDLLFFQGPHFGDRYGIMAYTQKALADKQIPVLAATCVVATINLILPAGQGAAAKDELTCTFNIPMQKKTSA